MKIILQYACWIMNTLKIITDLQQLICVDEKKQMLLLKQFSQKSLLVNYKKQMIILLLQTKVMTKNVCSNIFRKNERNETNKELTNKYTTKQIKIFNKE